SNLDGEPAQDFALSVDHEPALLDLAYLRGIGFHCFELRGNAEKLRILHKKTAQPERVAPNPPKEEEGGDELQSGPLCRATMLRCKTIPKLVHAYRLCH